MENKYDSLISEPAKEEVGVLNQSIFAAKETDPDKFGKIYEMAKEKNLPVDLVERNYDSLSGQVDSKKYENLLKQSPKLAQYLSTVENAKIAKDDTDHLSKVESDIGTMEKVGSLFQAMASGSLRMASGLAKAPALLPDMSEMLTGDTFGKNPYKKDQIEHILKNPVTNYLDESADALAPAASKESVLQGLSEGRFYPLAVQVATNLPQLALTAINPAAGLSIMAASGAGNKMDENIEAGVDSKVATQNAIVTSGIETGIEMMGGIGGGGHALKDTIKSSILSMGKENTLQGLKESLRLIFKTGNEEGLEEFITTIAHGITDWSMGVNDKALDNILSEAASSYFVGAGSGSTVMSVGLGYQKMVNSSLEDFKSDIITSESSRIYTNMADFVKESKLFKRSPEKMKEYINKQAENTPVQDVYISVDKFDEYFQSKKVDPNQAAKDLNMGEEYAKAKETGADIKVDTGKWAVNTVETEHYDGLKDHVRFNQDALSESEMKEKKEKAKDEREEMRKVMAEEKARIEEDEKQGKAIVNKVYNRLVELGVDKSVAKEQASLYKFIEIQAGRTGMTPDQLWEKYDLKIQKHFGGMGSTPDMSEIPTELMGGLSKLAKDETTGEYAYDGDMLRRMLKGMMDGGAGQYSYNPETKKAYHEGSQYPSWFQNQNEKSENVIKILKKKINGGKLTEVQRDILNKLYEVAVDNEHRGVLYQQTKDKSLIIQHNVSGEKLRHALKIGGLAVPSLAITDVSRPLDNFGEITLLGPASMAKPSGKTRVFGADVYSPRYPRIDYDLSKQARQKYIDKFLAAKKAVTNPTSTGYLEWNFDEIERSGPREMRQAAEVMYQFLADNGIDPKIVMDEVDADKVENYRKAGFDKFFGKETYNLVSDTEFIAKVIENYKAEFLDKGFDDLIEAFEKDENGYQRRTVRDYAHDISKIGKTEVDVNQTRYALRDQIKDAKLQNEFDKYASDFFAQLNAKEYVYDSEGSRKKHTLENVIRILKSNLRGGENFNYGVGNIRAKITPEFRSIKEIREAKGSLVSAEQFKDIKEEVNNELFKLAEEIKREDNYKSESFGYIDRVSDFLSMLAEGQSFESATQQLDMGELSDDLKGQISDYLEKLRTLPTEYFEANILRAVDPSEFKAAFVPYETAQDIKDALKAKGLAVIEYSSDEGRAKAIQEYAGQSEDVLFQSSPLKSRLTETVEKKVPNNATPAQVMATLKDMKPEEIEWSGIKSFLEGKEKVNKSELVEYLKANELKIVDFFLGRNPNFESNLVDRINKKLVGTGFVVEMDEEDGSPVVFRDDEQFPTPRHEIPSSVETIVHEERYRTEYSDQIDKLKAELKAEMLKAGSKEEDVDLYLEETLHHENDNPESDYPSKKSYEIFKQLQPLMAKEHQLLYGDEIETKYEEYKLDGGDNYREVLFTLPVERDNSMTFGEWFLSIEGDEDYKGLSRHELMNIYEDKIKPKRKEFFKSSHWEQKNILAHTRLTDRVDQDGKKVLFVEEIQSDWHQAGRKKGYKKTNADQELKEISNKKEQLTERGTVVRREIRDILKNEGYLGFDTTGQALGAIIDHDDFAKRWEISEEFLPRLTELRSEYVKILQDGADLMNQESALSKGVPNAPFKKTWHEFAFKRILMMAVDGGYDKVAWTTGDQQAERFDLSKHVGKVVWDEDTKMLTAYNPEKTQTVIQESNVTKEKLEDYVGKEVAQKLVDMPVDEEGSRTLEGLDLKIGGEGMKGFYDKILVDYANKMGKKHGAKVGETEVVNGEDKSKDYSIEKINGNRYGVFHKAGALMQAFGTIEEAEALIKQYSDFNKDKVHSLEITPSLKNEIETVGLSLFQQNQGSYNKQTRTITLFKKADRSTFMHESAHFFFDVLGDLSKTSPEIKADFDKILKWVGAESAEQLNREHHEKFARGFEAYLMEGKSPSRDLRKAFNTFKVWLVGLYRDIKGIEHQLGEPLELNDEIRGVMDRMLATEEEINAAQVEANLNEVLTGTPEEKEMFEEARVMAEAKLNKQLMEDLERKRQKEYKTKFDMLVKENRAKLSKLPIYNAIEVLVKGKTAQGEVTEKVKIDTDSLVRSFGEDTAKELQKRHMTSKSDGMDYQMVAEMFGYANAEAFIGELMDTDNLESTARQQANDTMKMTDPDLFKSAEIKTEAMAAIHNEKRSLLLKYQYEFLFNKARGTFNQTAKRLISRSPIDKVVREEAKNFVGKLSVAALEKPYVYLKAERKASQEAAKAFVAGDFEQALKFKRLELLNNEIYRFISEAKVDKKKFDQWVKRVYEKSQDLAKKRDMDLVNVARAVLLKFGYKSDKVEDPVVYLNKVKEYDVALYNTLEPIVSDAIKDAGPLETITYDKFVEMRDTVKTLWSMSKENKQIEIDGKRVDKEEIIDQLKEQIEKHNAQDKEIRINPSKLEQFKTKTLSFLAATRRVEHWVELMDLGHKGVFRTYIWNPISEATQVYRIEKAKVIDQFKKILEDNKSIFTQQAIRADNLLLNGQPMVFKNKAELLMAMLHTGNLSNKSKLLRGYGWGTVDENGNLDSRAWDEAVASWQRTGVLTEQDYKFLQAIWDLMEVMKPAAQKAHKKMYGYYFSEITANEIETPWGSFRGGYIPAKADSYTNEDAAIREERQELEKNNNSFMFPTTGRGFTKSRVDAYAAPLSLNMNLLGSHIDSVSRFSYIEPVVKDVAKIVMDKQFRAELAKIDPELGKEMLVPWLQRAAQQKVVMPSANGIGKLMDAVAGYLRTSVAMQFMIGNVTNTLQQYTGVIVAASKVKPSELKNALGEYITNRKQVLETITSKSNFMKANFDSNLYEAQSAIEEIIVNPNTFESMQSFAKAHTYFLQSATQGQVNTIVWLGAYNQAIKAGESEAEAVRTADSAVRMTQGSVNAEDVSRFETGTATQRLFTQFAGYFNMLANLNATEIQKIAKTVGLKKGAGKLFYLYLMTFMIPAVLSDVIVKAMSGKLGDDEEDDGYLDETFSVLFGSQVKTGLAMVPYAGPVISSTINRFNGVSYDDRLTFSPVLSVLESSAGVPAKIVKDFSKEELKKQTVKDIFMLVGMASNLPVGPVGKPVGYLMDVNSGKADPSGPIDFTRGLISGAPGTQ